MSRLEPISKDSANYEVKTILDAIEKRLGRVPNMLMSMANAPAVLRAYFMLSDASASTSFGPMLREQIALTVAEANHCRYCLAAHSSIGKTAGLTPEDITMAKEGQAKSQKTAAILHFAKTLVEKQGKVTESDTSAVQQAGVNPKEMAEILLVVMVNMFTNYFNHLTDPAVDFPET